jgi:serine acetyltransferase
MAAPALISVGIAFALPVLGFAMMTLWSDIRSDVAFRHQLRYPDGSGPLGWLRVWLPSRGILALAVHRLARDAKDARQQGRLFARPLGWLVSVARHVLLIAAKVHVASSTRIAPGVSFPDGGNLVLGALEIGPGTVIHRNVTIGMGLLDGGRPRLGSRVLIGSDCVVYGAVTIGDGATLLPGSVVSRNVPAGAVVAGNPPRVVATGVNNARLLRAVELDATRAGDAWPILQME